MAKYHHSTFVETSPFFRKTTRMPSPRRVKVFGILIFLAVVAYFMWSASLRQHQVADLRTAGDFYEKTLRALDQKPESQTAEAGADDSEEVSRAMSERLKEAAQVAKDKANKKAPKPDNPSDLVGVGNAREGVREEKGVAGRKKYQPASEQEPIKQETEEDHEAELQLNSILKKSPIIIFSKSYCPHSRRAKGILLEKYIIDPAPFVVELDQHPLGEALQALLAERTGRRTVPNVLINGVSIGGGDEIARLDSSHSLIEKVQDLGGRKMLDVRLRPIENGDYGLR